MPVGINNNAVLVTDIGGIAVQFTAGENLVKGNIVDIKSDGKVYKCVVDVPAVIGVVYEAANADASVWVVLHGVAEVYFIGDTTAGNLARGFLTADAGYVAGQALNEAIPTSPFATDKHFTNWGTYYRVAQEPVWQR
jgi:hypothetical protein